MTAFLIGMIASIAAQSTTLAVRDRTNAFPSIAANGQVVVVAWGASTPDAAPDVYVAVSEDSGRTFHHPSRVNDVANRANLSAEQPPRVTLVPRRQGKPSIVVAWTSKTKEGTQLLFARSDDGGNSFGPAAAVPGTNAPGNRGWEATTADRGGSTVAVWLDHRELAQTGSATGHSGHQHGRTSAEKRDGVARAQLSKLFFARLEAPDSATSLTGGVCYCCKTAIATGKNGEIYTAWRHVYPGNIRDIAFTMSQNGGRTFAPPSRVSNDGWVLDGCPENGPAIGVDNDNRIHVVWPTLLPAAKGNEPTLALFYASSANGREFTPRQQLPVEGFAGHPQLAVAPGGQLVVAWDEHVAGARRIAVARGAVAPHRNIRFVRQQLNTASNGSNPAIATTNDRTIVAWTSQGIVRVESFPIVR